MSTIDSKAIIDEIIRNNGFYLDDPQVHQIVEYINAFGNTIWGVTWVGEPAERRERYMKPSQYINNPKLIWKRTSH